MSSNITCLDTEEDSLHNRLESARRRIERLRQLSREDFLTSDALRQASFEMSNALDEIETVEGQLRERLTSFDQSSNGSSLRAQERDYAERDLVESRRRLDEAQQVAHIGSWEWDIAANRVIGSDEMYRIFGFEPQQIEITYGTYLDFVHPEDYERVSNLIASIFLSPKPLDYEYRILLEDGSERVIHARGEVVLRDGLPVRMIGTAQDVSERRRAEDDIKRALSALSATLDSTADGILVVSRKGRVEGYNKKFLEMWGVPHEIIKTQDDRYVMGHAVSQVKDKEAFVAKLEELSAQPEAESYDLIELIDGRAFERYSQPQRVEGHSIGRVWSFRDVTERRKHESERARMLELEQEARLEAEHIGKLRQDVLEREEKTRRELQATFDAMTDAVVLVDRNDQLMRANRTFYEKFDLVPQECIGRPMKTLVHREKDKFKDAESCPICELRRRGERTAIEFPPGVISEYPIFASTAPITDGDGKIVAVIEVIRDLTDLYAAREAAERERVSLNATIEQMAEGFVVFDKAANIIRANRQAQNVLGFPVESLNVPGNLLLAEGRFATEAGETIALDDLPGRVALRDERVVDCALWYTRPDGQKLLLNVTASPFFDDESRVMGAVMLVRDVTERKRERERLQQAEKLRALGQLTSGVAHNFNNALAAVIGYVQLALPKVNNPDIEKYLRVIEQSAKDAARMVERIQNFSRARSRKDDLIPVRVADIVRDAIAITRPRWQHDAESLGIKYEVRLQWLANDEALINGEPSELREVFVNIILNALDAMATGGRLSIKAEAEASSLIISLADTGAGMIEEVRRRVFEPFFTTKGVAGLGMGLSESYRIIERHGGRIDVESVPGEGTIFTITLPIAATAEDEVTTDAAQEKVAGARVLVIEDDQFVRSVLLAILTEQGHAALGASSAAEGLRMTEERRFDLVFTDLAMPGADGIVAASEIKARSPETKVVLMSGYGADKARERARSSNSIDAIISKPFRLPEIRETIKKLLDKNR